MKLELVEGYKQSTNEVILSVCLTRRDEVVECLAVMVSSVVVKS